MSTPEPRNRRAADQLPAGATPERLPFPWLFATRKTALQLIGLVLSLQQQNLALQAENIRLQDQLNRYKLRPAGGEVMP